MKNHLFTILLLLFFSLNWSGLQAQKVAGEVLDESNGEPLIGANVVLKDDPSKGTVTDWDGSFELNVPAFPVVLNVSYIGYAEKDVTVNSADEKLKIQLGDDAVTIDLGVTVKADRISEKQKAAPLTVESMDINAIKQTSSDNFYDGLGNMKGVDLTAASLGFKVINTRGFNSTSPVRSLQIIDGVDNQSPGLNFSLGNFLGSSELDVIKVDIIQGAASAYYGPNAFNGVISMETKNPFYQKGLGVMLKGGERNMFDSAIRWADVVKNKDGKDFMGYKLNFSYLRADDWEAENYSPVDGTLAPEGNPGGWDQVNTYGDEYFSLNDYSSEVNSSISTAGLGIFHRTGYNEIDLVDYGTRNLKANVALHFRTDPSAEDLSPEFIISSSMGNGTTVYQGDNRFSLRDIFFFQNRLEYRKKGKYFIRAYATNEDAGNSYDPYFTALRLQEYAKDNETWGLNYVDWWQTEGIFDMMQEMGYEVTIKIDPDTGLPFLCADGAEEWIANNQDKLKDWHEQATAFADAEDIQDVDGTNDFLIPGTADFQREFDRITSLKNNEGGTRFFDKSALYHVHGEYVFETDFLDEIKVGANARQYRPNSDGTVFSDSVEAIVNNEFGLYGGFMKKFSRKFILTGTLRVDKNQNFDYLFTPAGSFVYSPDPLNYLRFSFSSGVRNPTLSDQYLNFDVGRATLLGNLTGFQNLIDLDSFVEYLESSYTSPVTRLSIDPIRPERVKTFEFGYRTTLFESLYADASYYFNIYDDFIGYNIGVVADLDEQTGIPQNVEVFRVAANSTNQVTTQGFAIGLNYYFGEYYGFSGNYSWNRLNKEFVDDPIVPAFNTPEHKYNVGFSGRNIPLSLGNLPIKNISFNVNYKWVQGFLFEGSPQFTGLIEDYGLVDGQVSFNLDRYNTTLKIGASNILDNRVAQTYGGPEIGRLAYISLVYDFKKK